MTTLILIRHGETMGNVEQVWHGRLDAPLSPRGETQVAATALAVAQLAVAYPVDVVYSSPLKRARVTAEVIAAALSLPVTEDEGLSEFDLGDWEGRSFAALRDEENLWEHWKVDPTFAPPNGESPWSFAHRVVATFRRIVAAHAGQTLVVVTHGGVLSNLLAIWVGKAPGDWRRWEPHNCAITLLQGDGDEWSAGPINDTSHLPAEAIISRTIEAWDV